jgi:intracellular multiplication protein IcmD
MKAKQAGKGLIYFVIALLCTCAGTAFAVSGTGVGSVADTVIGNLSPIAKLITAGSYVAGFGFAVAAIVKFKAHKDNPTQIAISMPIALLFVAAALIGIPSVFKTTGSTLFGASGAKSSISGLDKF